MSHTPKYNEIVQDSALPEIVDKARQFIAEGYFRTSSKNRRIARLPPGMDGIQAMIHACPDKEEWAYSVGEFNCAAHYLRDHAEGIELDAPTFLAFKTLGGPKYGEAKYERRMAIFDSIINKLFVDPYVLRIFETVKVAEDLHAALFTHVAAELTEHYVELGLYRPDIVGRTTHLRDHARVVVNCLRTALRKPPAELQEATHE